MVSIWMVCLSFSQVRQKVFRFSLRFVSRRLCVWVLERDGVNFGAGKMRFFILADGWLILCLAGGCGLCLRRALVLLGRPTGIYR
jgi:hypothetical protein